MAPARSKAFFAGVLLCSMISVTLAFRKKVSTADVTAKTQELDGKLDWGRTCTNECSSLNTQNDLNHDKKVIYDPACANPGSDSLGGLGCSVKGHKMCRFCTYQNFGAHSTPRCPECAIPRSRERTWCTGECSNLNSQNDMNHDKMVIYDPACANPGTDALGGLGCSVKGHKMCRFCTFRNFGAHSTPACPSCTTSFLESKTDVEPLAVSATSMLEEGGEGGEEGEEGDEAEEAGEEGKAQGKEAEEETDRSTELVDEDDGEATSWELTSSLLQTEGDGDNVEDAKDVTNDNRSYVGGSLLEEAKEANELEWGSTLHSWAQHYYNAGRTVTADSLSSDGYSIAMCSDPRPNQMFNCYGKLADAEAFVKKKWNQGYSLAGWKINDAKGSCIKMSKNVGISGDIWRRRGSVAAIEQAIKRAWATNRRILDITGHKQGYTMVAGKSSEMSGMQSYKYTSSWRAVSRWIKKKWNTHFYITAMTKRAGTYFVVMTKNHHFKGQRYAWAKNDNKAVDEINKGYKDSHRITTLFDAHDQTSLKAPNRFFVVMSKVSGSKLFANKNAQCAVKFRLK